MTDADVDPAGDAAPGPALSGDGPTGAGPGVPVPAVAVDAAVRFDADEDAPQPVVDHGPVEEEPALALEVFGERLPMARSYVNLLVDAGMVRGLVGPREKGRIWSRHVLNCAVVAPRLSAGDRVVDIGSGAGLPGLPLAIARPDVSFVLLEPLLRRATFLEEAVELLGLTNVSVVRARAEEVASRINGTVVTARAVAPLPTLLGWALPLTTVGGAVVVLRGSTAVDEVKDPSLVPLLRRWGGETPKLVTYAGIGDETTTVQLTRRTLGTMGSALAKKAENRARREARKNAPRRFT